MKILHTIQGMTASLGGPSTCTHDLMVAMYRQRQDIELLTVNSGNADDIVLGIGSSWLKLVPNDLKTPLQLSSNLKAALESTNYDLYHSNGLWAYANHKVCDIARRKEKPYVISPHGMLYPTALKISYWKKWPMLKLWYNHDILSATCVHATCEEEARYIRAFGYKGPIAVIPNPVVFPEYALLATSKPKGRKKIGFLGRLHPIKKVEQVLYALALLKDEELAQISFQIMGKYDEQYENWLRSEVLRLNLNDCVEFIGFVSGEDKYRHLRDLWALMVPSAQENFGMIVPEALICGTPVYASLGTPWNELPIYDCGWWKDNSPESIADVLRVVIDMTEDDVLEKGRKGRDFVERNYRADIVAEKMWYLYDWIIGGGKAPEFVEII